MSSISDVAEKIGQSLERTGLSLRGLWLHVKGEKGRWMISYSMMYRWARGINYPRSRNRTALFQALDNIERRVQHG